MILPGWHEYFDWTTRGRLLKLLSNCLQGFSVGDLA